MAAGAVFVLSLHFDRLPGQFCRLLERLAGHYIEHCAGGALSGSAGVEVAAEVDELVALAQFLALGAAAVEAAVIRAGGSAEEASRVRASGDEGFRAGGSAKEALRAPGVTAESTRHLNPVSLDSSPGHAGMSEDQCFAK